MTIEATLERIAVALEKIAGGDVQMTAHPAPQPPAAAAPPTPVASAPVVPVTPPPVAAPAPAAAPAATGAPFNDGPSLTAYVMQSYQALGAEKGAQIQTVLNNLGYQNINDVKPEHYAQFHQGVEALKQ